MSSQQDTVDKLSAQVQSDTQILQNLLPAIQNVEAEVATLQQQLAQNQAVDLSGLTAAVSALTSITTNVQSAVAPPAPPTTGS